MADIAVMTVSQALEDYNIALEPRANPTLNPEICCGMHSSFCADSKHSSDIYVKDDFCDVLKHERKPPLGTETGDSREAMMTYAFRRGSFQFLNGRAEDNLNRDTLAGVLSALEQWAHQGLSANHVSSPALHVFVAGSWRALMQDNVAAKWHYVLPVSHNSKSGILQILRDVTDAQPTAWPIGSVNECRLKYNRLIVHPVSMCYAIETASRSMDPMEGDILLDGYIW